MSICIWLKKSDNLCSFLLIFFVFDFKMPKKPKKEYELGHKYAKPDSERLGIFSEMPYLQVKYKDPLIFNDKGKNFITSSYKSKNGTQHGYFDDEFKRIFIGEAIKGRGRKSKVVVAKLNQKPFMPTGETKIHSTPGDYYGTFGKYPAFSALLKKPKKESMVPTGKNFVTKNPKKGGPGYKDICIGPYPGWMKPPKAKKPHPPFGKVLDGPLHINMYPEEYFDKNPYPLPPKIKAGPEYVRPKYKEFPRLAPFHWNPIGPNKLEGKELFSTFQAPNKDPYLSQYDADKILSKKYASKNLYGFWCPQSTAEKSMFSISTIPANAFRVTVDTYNTAEPQFTKYLL